MQNAWKLEMKKNKKKWEINLEKLILTLNNPKSFVNIDQDENSSPMVCNG